MNVWKEWNASGPLLLYPVAETTPVENDAIVDLVSNSEDDAMEIPFSPLHHEIINFALACFPSRDESEAVETVIKTVRAAIKRVLPGATAALFGSKASGLSLPASDIDIVVLGSGHEIFAPRELFSKNQKRDVVQKLREIRHCLARFTRKRGKVIEARIPILRAEVDSLGWTFKVDISIGLRNSVDAVGMIRNHLQANPIIQPLFVVLKALLKEKALNEVFTGGMSSFTLFSTASFEKNAFWKVCTGRCSFDDGKLLSRTRLAISKNHGRNRRFSNKPIQNGASKNALSFRRSSHQLSQKVVPFLQKAARCSGLEIGMLL